MKKESKEWNEYVKKMCAQDEVNHQLRLTGPAKAKIISYLKK